MHPTKQQNLCRIRSQWHLYVQDTPTAGHGRGLSTAKVYRQDGTLVAAIVQEAMVRVPDPESSDD